MLTSTRVCKDIFRIGIGQLRLGITLGIKAWRGTSTREKVSFAEDPLLKKTLRNVYYPSFHRVSSTKLNVSNNFLLKEQWANLHTTHIPKKSSNSCI